MFTKLRNRFIAWLDRHLTAHRAALVPKPLAVIDPSAVLLPEAVIENLSTEAQTINIGAQSRIRGRMFIFANGGSIKIGQWCYIGARTEIWSMSSVTIGDRVLISHDVNIIDSSSHSKDPTQRHQHFREIVSNGHPKTTDELPGLTTRPIVIEDDVWISFGVTILAGVRIGARSIIAAGSIVTRDVPPDTIYRCAFTPVMTPLVIGSMADDSAASA